MPSLEIAAGPDAEPHAESQTMTMEQYLRTSFRPDCDFVDGRIEERYLGEYKHGLLQMEVGFWFRSRREEWNVRVVGELRTRVSADRVRIPDVTVVYDDAATAERVRVTAPLIAIEILSPEDRLSRVLLRLEDFRKMGIENIWLLDPEERVAFVYAATGLRMVEGSRLDVAGTGIYMDLSAVFAALD
jgi:Uma2 family endonuclease